MNAPHRTLRRILDPFILPRPSENPLADFELGWSPRSPRRRRRALIRTLAPMSFALFAFITLFLIARVTSDPGPFESVAAHYIISAVMTHIPSTLLLLLVLPLRRREPVLLSSNWDDYRLAGIPARQILLGLARVRMRGALLFLTYSLLLLASIGAIILNDLNFSEADDIAFFFTFFIAAFDYCLTVPMAATLDLTLWRRPVLARAAAILLLASTISPFFTIALFMTWEAIEVISTLFLPDPEFLVPPLVVAWFLARILLLSFLWHRTLRRLESAGP